MSLTPVTMHLEEVPYKKVLASCQDGQSVDFNTSFHRQDEVVCPVVVPSEDPYSFARWLPLILQTRNQPKSTAQVAKLSRAQVLLLIEASNGSIITGELSRAHTEDFQDEIFPAFQSLKFPSEGLFMRLDGCSPKDGRQTVPGRMSLHSIKDVILRLTTSQRARNELLKQLDTKRLTFDFTFLPFNDRMQSQREYRVYCCPNSGRITAVSQYCWHKPWLFANLDPTLRVRISEKIWRKAVMIHQQILDDLDSSDDMDMLMRTQGFSFDIFYDEDAEAAQLVELNVFGARSGCGSCLFHWVRDFDLLYSSTSSTEFRVSIT